MTYPFVAAFAQYGPRKGPVKAFIVHMAEGAGTVGFLSRKNERGVSVHYVIETNGRTVQMVHETDASGSINPNDLRTTDDPDTFGATVRKAVMGDWDHDPNSAVITVEVEGYAAAGPNSTQAIALAALVRDVRSRYPDIGLLGHRDFQDYKACPGKHIDWPSLGGHGEGDMTTVTITVLPFGGTFVIPTGATFDAIKLGPDGTVTGRKTWAAADHPSSAPYDATVTATSIRGNPYLRVTAGSLSGYLVSSAVVTGTPNPSDCAEAVTAERTRVKAAAVAAVEAIA